MLRDATIALVEKDPYAETVFSKLEDLPNQRTINMELQRVRDAGVDNYLAGCTHIGHGFTGEVYGIPGGKMVIKVGSLQSDHNSVTQETINYGKINSIFGDAQLWWKHKEDLSGLMRADCARLLPSAGAEIAGTGILIMPKIIINAPFIGQHHEKSTIPQDLLEVSPDVIAQMMLYNALLASEVGYVHGDNKLENYELLEAGGECIVVKLDSGQLHGRTDKEFDGGVGACKQVMKGAARAFGGCSDTVTELLARAYELEARYDAPTDIYPRSGLAFRYMARALKGESAPNDFIGIEKHQLVSYYLATISALHRVPNNLDRAHGAIGSFAGRLARSALNDPQEKIVGEASFYQDLYSAFVQKPYAFLKGGSVVSEPLATLYKTPYKKDLELNAQLRNSDSSSHRLLTGSRELGFNVEGLSEALSVFGMAVDLSERLGTKGRDYKALEYVAVLCASRDSGTDLHAFARLARLIGHLNTPGEDSKVLEFPDIEDCLREISEDSKLMLDALAGGKGDINFSDKCMLMVSEVKDALSEGRTYFDVSLELKATRQRLAEYQGVDVATIRDRIRSLENWQHEADQAGTAQQEEIGRLNRALEEATQEKARLVQENAQLATRLEVLETTAVPAERVVNVDTLTSAERRERAEKFQSRVAAVLGVTPSEIDAEAARIAAVLPHIDLVEATRLARSSILAGRGVNVAAPGQAQYKGWDSKFTGMVGLWGLKASNLAEYQRITTALKQAGIKMGDNDWLDPGDGRWY